MSSTFTVGVQGLKDIDFRDADRKLTLKAVQAVNKIADRTRTGAARKIREEINFTASYLSPSEGRLVVARRATREVISATVRARVRKTQMSRFLVSGQLGSKTGVSISIKPGSSKHIKRGFLMNLKGGNIGIGIHLKAGEKLRNRRKPKYAWVSRKQKNGMGVVILDTVSVDQAFGRYRASLGRDAARMFEVEFERLQDIINAKR